MKDKEYRHQDEIAESLHTAERVVPLILEGIGRVRSVVDVGGGSGAWLKVFQDLGVESIQLFDSPAVLSYLLIGEEHFAPIDLNVALPPPCIADLVVCVECAEHLRSERARPLVQWLTACAKIVVFSAAPPFQGGKEHVNERPPSFWHELFSESGFSRRDVLRGKIGNDPSIPFWYRQNLFLFTAPEVRLGQGFDDFLPPEFELVHKNIMIHYRRPGLGFLLQQFGPSLLNAVKRRFGNRNQPSGSNEPT
jgi:hypothetical protein